MSKRVFTRLTVGGVASETPEDDEDVVDVQLPHDLVGAVLGSAVKRSIGSTTGCTITEKAPTKIGSATQRS